MKRIVTCLVFVLVGFQALRAGDGFASPGTDHQICLKDGRTLNYREFGNCKGKLVLWFHGLNSSCREPGYVNEQICRSGLRIVAVERPGIGKSTYDCDREILDWPDDIRQLVAALGCHKFGIIATSGGSSYGCACALKMPHRVTHLALVSPYSPIDAPCIESGNVDGLVRFAANRPNLAKAALKATANQLERNPDKVMKRAKKKYSDSDVELVYSNPEVYQHRIENLHRVVAQGPCGLLTELTLQANDWGFEVCKIRNVPVSIWSGGDDPITPPSMAKYLNRQIRGSRLTTGPNDGHVTALTNHVRAILGQFQ